MINLYHKIRRIHPAFVLMFLDLVGLGIASYLSIVELRHELPVCSILKGCEDVARSQYARIGGPDGLPVAVFGVALSIILFVFAFIWWKTGDNRALAVHYGFSLVGVLFEGWFTYAELFLIHAVCIWCAAYGISLVTRFIVALWVWLRRSRYAAEESWGD